jgi:serine/threonine protein kinase
MLKKAEVIRLQQVEHMISEKNILTSLDHPFIVRLSGTFQGILNLYILKKFIIISYIFIIYYDYRSKILVYGS